MSRARRDGAPVSSEAELAAWLWDRLGVRLPSVACCLEHTSPFQAFADAYFAKHSVAVWHASRGFGGKSFMLAALGLTEAATLGTEVRVLGGSADQSENVVRYTAAWTELQAFAPLLAESGGGGREAGVTRSRVRTLGGGMVDALAASSRAVRGPHPTRLRIDEADELDVRILDAALGQTMAKAGVAAQTVISSTYHYADGTMAEVLRRAEETGWPVYRWCYKCTRASKANPHGWLTEGEIERKRRDVTAAMWAAEYDLQEPRPESRAFEPSMVDALFNPALGVYEAAPGEVIEVEPPEQSALYSTGADWAKEKDWTVIVTLRYDCAPARVVAYQRFQRLPWPMMAERFSAQATKYDGIASHDATGIGNVVADLVDVAATPMVLVGRRRSDILTRYLVGIEQGEVAAPMIRHPYTEHKHASQDDLFGSGHLPDSVCAFALAYYGAASQIRVTML